MEMPTDEDLEALSAQMVGFEKNLPTWINTVLKSQRWAPEEIEARFSNITDHTLKKYLRASYKGFRPLHFVAAFSWVTTAPMTSYYLGGDIRETHTGMDDSAVDALLVIDTMKFDDFRKIIECVYRFLDERGQLAVDSLNLKLKEQFPSVYEMKDEELKAPDSIDLKLFADSYYGALSAAAKRFREGYGIKKSLMQRVLGMSAYQYNALEDPDQRPDISPSIGARVRIAFKLDGHASFTVGMTHYAEFNKFREAQHVREVLLVEALKHVPEHSKNGVVGMIKGFSEFHIKAK